MKGVNKEELQDIFKGIANKEAKDFNRLYERYQKLVYGISFSILKNKEDSEEVVQVVFTKIWDMPVEYLPKNHEATWLYRLTKNETLNFLRKQKGTVNIEELYCIGEEDKELEAIVEKDTYNKILSKLEEKDQEIVSLKILSDLSFKEISKVLDMPIGTVQWRYYKALHTLKTLFGSVSMYIATMIALIMQRFPKKRQKEQQEFTNEEIAQKENEEEEQQEMVQTGTEEQKRQEPIEDGIESEKTQQENTNTNIKEEIIIKQEESAFLTPVEVGLLSFSSVFLISAILFFIFFIKHQQKAKRKVSK